MKDLAVLVADKNIEHTIRGLLDYRSQALGIRSVDYDVFVHPNRDPGCLNEAHDILRPLASQYAYALVLFDHEGCGQEAESTAQLAKRVEGNLRRNGWSDRARTIILVPELETWVWSRSTHVAECLGWSDQPTSLRDWLVKENLWLPDEPKPKRPKEAMEAALRHARKPRSSAIYLQLARQVSLRGHTEPAFVHFVDTLRMWFPTVPQNPQYT